MKTIEFIKSMELPTGGIAAWEGQRAYPECSGYLVPTLLNYGEHDLAERIGKWLVSIQNRDGSFNGLDGIPHPFDTAACMEGLQALGYADAVERATIWLETMLHNGYLRDHPGTLSTPIYNLRAMAIMGIRLDTVPPLQTNRTHYLAYALEGLHNMGLDIKEHLTLYSKANGLLSMSDYGSDTCATAQMAVLCLKNNIPCPGLIEAVRGMVDIDGGVWHDSGDHRKCAWTAKYYLDMEYEIVRSSVLPETPLRERPKAAENVRSGNRKAKK